jgi:hypothetical protein
MVMQPAQAQPMLDRYRNRRSRLYGLLRPPLPLIANPNEEFLPESNGIKLFLGGAGSNAPTSFLNIDLFATSGVDVVADIHRLPFANDSVAAIECDAVLNTFSVRGMPWPNAFGYFARLATFTLWSRSATPFMHTLRTISDGPSMVLKNCSSNLRLLMPEYEQVPRPPCLLSFLNF